MKNIPYKKEYELVPIPLENGQTVYAKRLLNPITEEKPYLNQTFYNRADSRINLNNNRNKIAKPIFLGTVKRTTKGRAVASSAKLLNIIQRTPIGDLIVINTYNGEKAYYKKNFVDKATHNLQA